MIKQYPQYSFHDDHFEYYPKDLGQDSYSNEDDIREIGENQDESNITQQDSEEGSTANTQKEEEKRPTRIHQEGLASLRNMNESQWQDENSSDNDMYEPSTENTSETISSPIGRKSRRKRK